MKPLLIYDNSASQIGKGQTFALERVRKMLQKAYLQYGKEAYVVQLDVSKYFDTCGKMLQKASLQGMSIKKRWTS
ncbi:MAG: hypothetical protein LUG91_09080 [Ruminococcus sp.]|nr:hypothetical protein [Ruminococcus sp.]